MDSGVHYATLSTDRSLKNKINLKKYHSLEKTYTASQKTIDRKQALDF